MMDSAAEPEHLRLLLAIRLAKWKIGLTNPKHSLPKLLLVRPRYCCRALDRLETAG